MVFDGVGNRLAQAVVERVVAAHGALQLGELAHHVGHKVGLGQLGGQVGVGHHSGIAQLRGNGFGNRAHALHALALRAQLVVVDHLAQAIDARGQRFLAILVEEELGIGQARAHHALVAAGHKAGVFGADVAHYQELVGQLARSVEQREVFLVGLHREDEALLRHVEKLWLKSADEHVGALDQRGDFVQQRIVFDGAGAATHLGCGGLQLAGNLGLALGERGDHGALRAQLPGVAVGILEHHGRDGGLETVALGGVACRQAQRLHGHHVAAVQCHQPVRGAHKAHAAPAWHVTACGELVAHHLGDGQFGHGLVQRFLQALGQRGAAHSAVVEQGLCLAIGGALQRGHGSGGVGHISPQRGQLFQQCGGGVACGVQAHGHGHEFLRLGLVSGLRCHGADVGSQAARRCVSGEHSVRRGQPLGLQLCQQHASEGVAQFLQRLRGQLFNKQFNQQIRMGHGVSLASPQAAFFCCCWALSSSASTSSAQARGAIGKPRRARLSR